MDHASLISPLSIEAESPRDVAAREALLDAAFGPSRFAKTSERLRAGRLPAFAFSLVEEGCLVGTVRLWHVMAGGAPALLLGPLAVAATHEGQGHGSRLMRHALGRAAAAGHGAVLLVGDEPYYGRFGFRRDLTENLVLPGPVERDRFLAIELVSCALDDAFGLVVGTGERVPFVRPAVRSTALERVAA